MNFDNFSLQDALKAANSPKGRRLFAVLGSKYPEQLQAVRTALLSGNSQSAQEQLQALLSKPEVQEALNGNG